MAIIPTTWNQADRGGSNTLFLQTVGTYSPTAVIRATQPGQATGTDYAFEITERGDVDRAPTNPVI